MTIGTIIGEIRRAMTTALNQNLACARPSAAVVPRTVARIVVATPTMPLFFAASSQTGLVKRSSYQRRENSLVYRELRNAIMSGAIMPGTTVTIRALAKALGTSQMPAREALRRLVAEHALEMLPNRTVKLPVVTGER